MTKQDVIKAGGRACKQYNCVRIPTAEIQPTVAHFCDTVGIPFDQCALLGSTGKKPIDSGDIDLGVMDYYVDGKVLSAHGAKYNPGFGMWHLPWPINHDETRLVQIDVIVTCDLEWAKFAFDANFDDCPYSGATRNALLGAFVATHHDPKYDHFEYFDDGSLKVRIGRLYDRRMGVIPFVQKRDKPAGKLITLHGFEANALREQYGMQIAPEMRSIHDIHVMLFGDPSPGPRWTTSHLMPYLMNMEDKNRQALIIQITAKTLKGFGGKYIFPDIFAMP